MPSVPDALALAHGDYQRDLLTGRARWSGSDLTGNARKYSARYAQSRRALYARLQGAGFNVTVADYRNDNGRIMRVLYIAGEPVSALR